MNLIIPGIRASCSLDLLLTRTALAELGLAIESLLRDSIRESLMLPTAKCLPKLSGLNYDLLGQSTPRLCHLTNCVLNICP